VVLLLIAVETILEYSEKELFIYSHQEREEDEEAFL